MTIDDEATIEQTILTLLADRGVGKSICPSEAARRLQPDDWRPLMADVRRVARRLIEEQRLVVTQRGEVVDIETAKGPIRFQLLASPGGRSAR
ncbi:MAG: DUF3253 domain-containing protein [Planctomycetota bacterium]